MISESSETIKKRAQRILRNFKKESVNQCECQVIPIQSTVGGGSLPEYTLDSWGVEMKPLKGDVGKLELDFRSLPNPIIGRIIDDCYVLDCRTILDSEVPELASSLKQYFNQSW